MFHEESVQSCSFSLLKEEFLHQKVCLFSSLTLATSDTFLARNPMLVSSDSSQPRGPTSYLHHWSRLVTNQQLFVHTEIQQFHPRIADGCSMSD